MGAPLDTELTVYCYYQSPRALKKRKHEIGQVALHGYNYCNGKFDGNKMHAKGVLDRYTVLLRGCL